jgi:hypothetical protein
MKRNWTAAVACAVGVIVASSGYADDRSHVGTDPQPAVIGDEARGRMGGAPGDTTGEAGGVTMLPAFILIPNESVNSLANRVEQRINQYEDQIERYEDQIKASPGDVKARLERSLSDLTGKVAGLRHNIEVLEDTDDDDASLLAERRSTIVEDTNEVQAAFREFERRLQSGAAHGTMPSE